MKQKLVVGGAAIALMLGGAGVASAAPADVPATCAEAQAAGRTNIPRGDAAYAPALDRDGDGVACDDEEREGAGAAADDTDLDDAGPTDGTADEGDDDHDDDHDAEHEDGDHDDQVSVVPEGGAPTGDGSTQDGTGWWIGGGLLAALAAMGLAFRHRWARIAGLAGR